MRHIFIIKALGAGICLFVAACAPDERLAPIGEGPSAKNPQVSRTNSNVDGLIVGHRLMAAGEYDLALRSYYRAAADHGINSDVLTALGSANLKLGRLGQAEDMLRRAIRKDQRFVPAFNNLGVVLMEQGKVAEAKLMFQTAFALDSGESADIRENLKHALAKIEKPTYSENNQNNYNLVRQGSGLYELQPTP